MSNLFQSVVGPKRRYNNFPLDAEVLTSGQIGKLIPVQCDEVVPGDRFRQNIAFLMRFSPLSAPAMARFNVHFHSFYVPYRIITKTSTEESTWEKFIRKISRPTEEIPILPFINTSYSSGNTSISPEFADFFRVGSLADYLGFPVAPSNADYGDGTVLDAGFPEELGALALPFLAYQKIYNDIYRRDQIEQEMAFPIDFQQVLIGERFDINDASASTYYSTDPDGGLNQRDFTIQDLFTLRTRNYERDYFTSALPEPQFGDDVQLGSGAIEWTGYSPSLEFSNFGFSDVGLYASNEEFGIRNAVFENGTLGYESEDIDPGETYNFVKATINSDEISRASMRGSLRDVDKLARSLRSVPITVNEFRLAMQLQGLLEQINRSGTRYLEIMKSVYGVNVPDARLQRPVYLGGVKNPVTIGTVVQTSESQNTPQGTLTGKAQASGTGKMFTTGYEFKEHGYLITIMSVLPRTTYFGGMPRKFMKKYPEDFYLPNYDHLGEQEIRVSELSYEADTPNETVEKLDRLFGYTPRYAEYKSKLSTVHGEFRTTLQNWHVSRSFDNNVALNPDFIKAEPEDFSRIFEFENIENTSNEHFQAMIYIDTVAKRNMSKYSTPYTLY